MVVAFIWHWWISVILVGAAVLTMIGFVVQYLAQVTRPQYPGRRQGRQRYARR
jgi:hypothetical protein